MLKLRFPYIRTSKYSVRTILGHPVTRMLTPFSGRPQPAERALRAVCHQGVTGQQPVGDADLSGQTDTLPGQPRL